MRLKCCVKLWKIDHWSQGKESLLLEELICHYCNTSTEARVGRETCSLPQRAEYLPFGSLCWTLVCHLSISNFSKEVWNQDNWASFWVKEWCGGKKKALPWMFYNYLCWMSVGISLSPHQHWGGVEWQRLEGSTEVRMDWSWRWERIDLRAYLGSKDSRTTALMQAKFEPCCGESMAAKKNGEEGVRTSSLLPHLFLQVFVVVPQRILQLFPNVVSTYMQSSACGKAELGTCSRLVKYVGKISL